MDFARVHMVYITWHSAKVPVPEPVKALTETGRFKILKMKSDTLNNRFNPIPGLKTKAVFICDDDIYMPMHSLDFAFEGERKCVLVQQSHLTP